MVRILYEHGRWIKKLNFKENWDGYKNKMEFYYQLFKIPGEIPP